MLGFSEICAFGGDVQPGLAHLFEAVLNEACMLQSAERYPVAYRRRLQEQQQAYNAALSDLGGVLGEDGVVALRLKDKIQA